MSHKHSFHNDEYPSHTWNSTSTSSSGEGIVGSGEPRSPHAWRVLLIFLSLSKIFRGAWFLVNPNTGTSLDLFHGSERPSSAVPQFHIYMTRDQDMQKTYANVHIIGGESKIRAFQCCSLEHLVLEAKDWWTNETARTVIQTRSRSGSRSSSEGTSSSSGTDKLSSSSSSSNTSNSGDRWKPLRFSHESTLPASKKRKTSSILPKRLQRQASAPAIQKHRQRRGSSPPPNTTSSGKPRISPTIFKRLTSSKR